MSFIRTRIPAGEFRPVENGDGFTTFRWDAEKEIVNVPVKKKVRRNQEPEYEPKESGYLVCTECIIHGEVTENALQSEIDRASCGESEPTSVVSVSFKDWSTIVSIPQDKLLHDKWAGIICLFSFAVLYRFVSAWLCFVLADILTVCSLGGKELYDHIHSGNGHSVELGDFLYGLYSMARVNVAMLIMLV